MLSQGPKTIFDIHTQREIGIFKFAGGLYCLPVLADDLRLATGCQQFQSTKAIRIYTESLLKSVTHFIS